jgi:hypothetical protein
LLHIGWEDRWLCCQPLCCTNSLRRLYKRMTFIKPNAKRR